MRLGNFPGRFVQLRSNIDSEEYRAQAGRVASWYALSFLHESPKLSLHLLAAHVSKRIRLHPLQ